MKLNFNRPRTVVRAVCALAAGAVLLFAPKAAALTANEVPYGTLMWSAEDPFGFGALTNALAYATNAQARVTVLEGTAEADPVALPVASNALSVAEQALALATTNAPSVASASNVYNLAAAAYSLAGSNTAGSALGMTALQPYNTNGWTVSEHGDWITPAATNALDASLRAEYGPRVSLLEALTNLTLSALQPADTNGWTLSSHADFVTLPTVYSLVTAAVASNPGLTNLVYSVITNSPPRDVTNAYVGIITPYLAISNGVSPAALASWWETVRPFSSSPELLFEIGESVTGTEAGSLCAVAYPAVRSILSYTSDVVIPPMALGYPVRGLSGQGIFKGATNLLSVVLPETLVSLGAEAFADCQKLKTVTIPASVTHIGQGTFSSCLALESVYFEGVPPTNATGFAMFTAANPAARVYTRRGVSPAAFLVSDPAVLTGFYGPETVISVVLNGETNFPTADGTVDLGAAAGGGVSEEGVTNIFNGLIVAATNGLTGGGLSAATATNISTAIANSIATAATNALPQPTGVPYWTGTNGTEFATLDPGGVPLVWQVVDTVDTNFTVLTFSADFAESTAGLKPAQAAYTNSWGANFTEGLWVFDMPSIGGSLFYIVYNHPEEGSTWNVLAPWVFPIAMPATGLAQGTAYVQYLPVTLTNFVTRLATTNDLAGFLSIADYALWQTNVLDMIQAISNDAFTAQSTADGAVSTANQAAQDVGTIQQLLAGPGGYSEQIAGKVDMAGGTASNLTAVGTFSLFGYPWSWNTEFHTYDIGLDGGVTGQLFQEQHIYAKNGTGATIPEGAAVCVSGSQGANVLVGLASAADPLCKWTTIGLVTQTGGITNGMHGYVTTFGNVNDINTAAWGVSNTLWLAAGGTLTNAEPTAGSVSAKVKIGTVLRSHANQGRVFVNVLSIPDAVDVGALTNGQQNVTLGMASGTTVATATAGSEPVTLDQVLSLLEASTTLYLSPSNCTVCTQAATNRTLSTMPSATAWTIVYSGTVTNNQYIFSFVASSNAVATVLAGNQTANLYMTYAGGGGSTLTCKMEGYVYDPATSNSTEYAETATSFSVAKSATLPATPTTPIAVIPYSTNLTGNLRYQIRIKAVAANNVTSVTMWGGSNSISSVSFPVADTVALGARGAIAIKSADGYSGTYDSATRTLTMPGPQIYIGTTNQLPLVANRTNGVLYVEIP